MTDSHDTAAQIIERNAPAKIESVPSAGKVFVSCAGTVEAYDYVEPPARQELESIEAVAAFANDGSVKDVSTLVSGAREVVGVVREVSLGVEHAKLDLKPSSVFSELGRLVGQAMTVRLARSTIQTSFPDCPAMAAVRRSLNDIRFTSKSDVEDAVKPNLSATYGQRLAKEVTYGDGGAIPEMVDVECSVFDGDEQLAGATSAIVRVAIEVDFDEGAIRMTALRADLAAAMRDARDGVIGLLKTLDVDARAGHHGDMFMKRPS